MNLKDKTFEIYKKDISEINKLKMYSYLFGYEEIILCVWCRFPVKYKLENNEDLLYEILTEEILF